MTGQSVGPSDAWYTNRSHQELSEVEERGRGGEEEGKVKVEKTSEEEEAE